jgi:tRNA pseudouridine55 synthase
MTGTANDRGVEGIVVVDKPGDWTSHDVVARIRKLASTRKVGHAGTLDPMATGVLIAGVGRATRLLGHLALTDKDYEATMRLGVVTTTDDADGDVVAEVDASSVSDDALRAAMAALTGDIQQVPSAVSAIKVAGVPSYARARAGDTVELAARPVTVSRFDVLTRHGDDVDVVVTCSSGTYVRALARDVGASLGVGAHLTALRRTRVGTFAIDRARTLDELATDLSVIPLSEAAAMAFPRIDVDAETKQRLIYGQRPELPGVGSQVTAVFGPDRELVALAGLVDGIVRSLVVFAD